MAAVQAAVTLDVATVRAEQLRLQVKMTDIELAQARIMANVKFKDMPQ